MAVYLGVRYVIAVALVMAGGVKGFGQLRVLPSEQALTAFAGAAVRIGLRIQNQSGQMITNTIVAHLYQASTAVALPLQRLDWKTLTVLPAQTIVEEARLPMPEVRVPTLYLVQWANRESKVLGVTPIVLVPRDLLCQLEALGEPDGLGIYDLDNRIKQVLTDAKVRFIDLNEDAGAFAARLAIVLVPHQPNEESVRALRLRVRSMLKRGAAVIWIGSVLAQEHQVDHVGLASAEAVGAREECRNALPGQSALAISAIKTLAEPINNPGWLVWAQRIERGVLVQCPVGLIANLGADPLVQQRLIRVARVALKPEVALFSVKPNDP